MADTTARGDGSGPAAPPQTNSWDAALYDTRHAFVWQYGSDLLELLAPQPGERILDLGAGTGHLTARIAAAGAQVVGLDAAPSMVEQARQAYPDLEFVLGDAADFSFPEPFDAVFSNATLHWVPRAAEAAACVARALKPGGRFVAELGGQGNIRAIVAALDAAREATGVGLRPDLNPWYFPSIGQYTSLLEHHGLTVTAAHLFERPTRLEDGDEGLRNWLAMFALPLLADLAPDQREAVVHEVEHRLRPAQYQDGAWVVDYRRLRVVAVKG